MGLPNQEWIWYGGLELKQRWVKAGVRPCVFDVLGPQNVKNARPDPSSPTPHRRTLLNLVKSNRMETLMQALAEVTAQGLGDPMVPEWICIQSRGMKQWISLELARIHGISAHLKFMFPRELIHRVGEAPRLDSDTLLWSVLAQLDSGIRTGPLARLAPYVQSDGTGKKQVQLAQVLASLLDDYQVYRPDMLLNWEKNGLPGHVHNPVEQWQSALWRHIAATTGTDPLPGRMDALIKAAAAGKLLDLPRRICLFGLSAVPPLFMQFFSVLDTAVFVFVLTPSSHFFFDIASPRQMDRMALQDLADEHWEITNPLLASLGRSGRQFLGLLEEKHYQEPFGDLFSDPAPAGAQVSMLCRVQSDILNLILRHPGGPHPPVAVASEDDSISIHACHSPMREAQVLKDLLLDTFERRPDISPHDMIVMMPDIEAYAPYIEAVFAQEHPVPFTISDRRQKSESPVIEAFIKILDLKGSRLEQSRVMDLLLSPAIAENFDIVSGDIQTLGEMVDRAGVLWGLDADHRRHLTGTGFEENTWQFGLQRLFMGFAMPSHAEALVNGVMPCPFMEGLEAQILGRFAHFCHTLFQHLAALDTSRTPQGWASVFTALVQDMIKAASTTEPDIRFLFQTFQDLALKAEAGGFEGKIGFFAVKDLIEGKLDQTISQGSFLAGGVTFCNLMPMRSIPFKVVALMGMDEAAFPRKIFPKSFDLMAATPRPGDKNPRDEDRYLFLETLLSARDRLIITFTGMGIKDNAPVPCSGVVSELADVITRSFTFPSGFRWWVTHRLHPFNPVYFDGAGDYFSYSADQCCIARARAGQNLPREATFSGKECRVPGTKQPGQDTGKTDGTEHPGFGIEQQDSGNGPAVSGEPAQDSNSGSPAPAQTDAAPEPDRIFLASLHRFFKHPLAMYCNTTLEMAYPVTEEPQPDREPFLVSGLARYQLGSWVVTQPYDLDGDPESAGYPLARAGGLLPFGNQGRLEWEDIARTARPVRDLAKKRVPASRLDPMAVELALSDSRIQGMIADLYAADTGIIRCVVDFGRINAKRLLKNWITHLVLTLAVPGTPVTTGIIGQDLMGRRPGIVRKFKPMGDAARPCLENLVSLYRRGLEQACPFFPDTCFVLAQSLAQNGFDTGEPAVQAAMKKAGPAWFNAHGNTGEKTDRYTALWLRDRPDPFESPAQLLASGMVDHALAVFKPLLAHLEDGS
jgi:exodeoxyribonuclease V gamma subunit